MRFFGLAIATGGGVGYVRFAPGTFGSALGLIVWAAVPQILAIQVAVIVTVCAAGTWSASIAERHFRKTDPGAVVIDEVAGMLVTLLLNPVGWGGAVAGFLAFRLFDIVKPFPANRLERLPGGLGIMADDIAAAVYANLLLRLGIFLLYS
jgi:phosphatidylglycerophosphatase A